MRDKIVVLLVSLLCMAYGTEIVKTSQGAFDYWLDRREFACYEHSGEMQHFYGLRTMGITLGLAGMVTFWGMIALIIIELKKGESNE